MFGFKKQETAATSQTDHDAEYQAFERLIAERVASLRGPLFTTDASGLWEAYLAGIPGETQRKRIHDIGVGVWHDEHSGLRQHYNCRRCRQFVERYGGLVSIDLAGGIHPVLFDGFRSDDCPVFFGQSSMNMTQQVIGTLSGRGPAKVTGVFINSETTWGTPYNVAGKGSKCEGHRWTHLHGIPHSSLESYTGKPLTGDQRMAELKQDYIILKRALSEIPLEAAVQAVRVLEADAVDRSEKTLGVAKWFLDLHQSVDTRQCEGGPVTKRIKDNLIWLAVAQTPPGWCHVRTTMIGSLLKDIVDGLDFNTIKRRWDSKMHPLAYQRPQAPPTDGQIDAAEKLVEKLGLRASLVRRYATLADVLKFEWKPNEVNPRVFCADCGADVTCLIGESGYGGCATCRSFKVTREFTVKGGAFDNLRTKAKGIKPVELPPKAMDWALFRSTVLPTARTVEVQLTGGTQPFYGLVTVVDKASPPMLQWDGLVDMSDEGIDKELWLPRNPVSWYFYHGMSTAAMWGLKHNGPMVGWWQRVDAVFLAPHQWQQPEKFKHQPQQVHFAISAARDSRTAGGGYFPETLKSELHGIRSVIEAHSKSATLAGRDEGDANGIALTSKCKLTVRVNGQDSYVLSL